MNSLGKRLRELRKGRGYTVREFAHLLNKSPGYVSRIEARGEIPSPELLCAIAEIYEIQPDALLELAKQMQLKRVEQDIAQRHSDALSLFRKGRK